MLGFADLLRLPDSITSTIEYPCATGLIHRVPLLLGLTAGKERSQLYTYNNIHIIDEQINQLRLGTEHRGIAGDLTRCTTNGPAILCDPVPDKL